MSVVVTESLPLGRESGLADAALYGELRRFLARRLGEVDAEDVVQATLTEALASPNVPSDVEGLRRFVFGIARHKLADHFRRRGRETSDDGSDEPAQSGDSVGVRDLLRWAERELPPEGEAQRTFEWMLREGDGERLEQIAEEERLPAPRVRQRVSRLRRYLRERWIAQAALAGVGAGLIALFVYFSFFDREPRIAREVPVHNPELERARALRKQALQHCEDQDPRRCIDELDRARSMDPAGDRDPRVREARAAASAALAPVSAPTTSATAPAPSSAPAPIKGSAPMRSPVRTPKAVPSSTDSLLSPTNDVPRIPAKRDSKATEVTPTQATDLDLGMSPRKATKSRTAPFEGEAKP